jgi:hypothetical protein
VILIVHVELYTGPGNDAAVAHGAEVLDAPKEWPEYHAGYYAAFVRDPDVNNVEAVCHSLRKVLAGRETPW